MAAGVKTGGRKKGTPNKATITRQQEVAESGLTPLDFMLSIMREETETQDIRLEAAKAAAPYVHPRLNAVDLSATDGTLAEAAAYAWQPAQPAPR